MRESIDAQIGVSMPASMKQAVRELAAEQYVSQSAVVRKALDRFFHDLGKWPRVEERA